MRQLIETHLEQTQQDALNILQARVDAETTFTQRVERSQSLWKSKGGTDGEAAFVLIKETLTNMCVGVKVCNYCEGNEANDIEHIYPKSYFPEATFHWQNYLLACKQCNTGYKLDKCLVMDAEGVIHETTRGNEPPHRIIAMINPRIENPDSFIWFNIDTAEFQIRHGLTIQNFNKADKTLEILALNQRDFLKESRRIAAIKYFDTMDRLRRIVIAQTIGELRDALNPYQNFINDLTLPINSIKENLKESVRLHIQKSSHPSVWYAIKTLERIRKPRWQQIFAAIPEAENW
jgi:uncharacterized protein (TIGR02646 family)